MSDQSWQKLTSRQRRDDGDLAACQPKIETLRVEFAMANGLPAKPAKLIN